MLSVLVKELENYALLRIEKAGAGFMITYAIEGSCVQTARLGNFDKISASILMTSKW